MIQINNEDKRKKQQIDKILGTASDILNLTRNIYFRQYRDNQGNYYRKNKDKIYSTNKLFRQTQKQINRYVYSYSQNPYQKMFGKKQKFQGKVFYSQMQDAMQTKDINYQREKQKTIQKLQMLEQRLKVPEKYDIKYGKVGLDTLSTGLQGAQIGAAFGPIGAGVTGGLSALIGGIASYMNERDIRRQTNEERIQQLQTIQAQQEILQNEQKDDEYRQQLENQINFLRNEKILLQSQFNLQNGTISNIQAYNQFQKYIINRSQVADPKQLFQIYEEKKLKKLQNIQQQIQQNRKEYDQLWFFQSGKEQKENIQEQLNKFSDQINRLKPYLKDIKLDKEKQQALDAYETLKFKLGDDFESDLDQQLQQKILTQKEVDALKNIRNNKQFTQLLTQSKSYEQLQNALIGLELYSKKNIDKYVDIKKYSQDKVKKQIGLYEQGYLLTKENLELQKNNNDLQQQINQKQQSIDIHMQQLDAIQNQLKQKDQQIQQLSDLQQQQIKEKQQIQQGKLELEQQMKQKDQQIQQLSDLQQQQIKEKQQIEQKDQQIEQLSSSLKFQKLQVQKQILQNQKDEIKYQVRAKKEKGENFRELLEKFTEIDLQQIDTQKQINEMEVTLQVQLQKQKEQIKFTPLFSGLKRDQPQQQQQEKEEEQKIEDPDQFPDADEKGFGDISDDQNNYQALTLQGFLIALQFILDDFNISYSINVIYKQKQQLEDTGAEFQVNVIFLENDDDYKHFSLVIYNQIKQPAELIFFDPLGKDGFHFNKIIKNIQQYAIQLNDQEQIKFKYNSIPLQTDKKNKTQCGQICLLFIDRYLKSNFNFKEASMFDLLDQDQQNLLKKLNPIQFL